MKLGHLYNLKSFDKLKESAQNLKFADSALGGVVLARTLVAVDPRIFQKQYPELTFVNSGIEANNIGGYARLIESLRLLPQGDFADAADEADNKGKIGLQGENNFLKVFEKEGFSTWTETELRQADMQNINLPSQYLAATNKLYLQKVDEIGYLGQDTNVGGNSGLLNNTYFGTTVAPQPWATATPQQLYDMVALLINTQWDTVYNTPAYMANRVVMPIGMYNKLRSSILNTAAGAISVLKSLQTNFPEIVFTMTFRTTDVMVAYSTNSEAMVMRIPEPLMVGEIIKKSSFKYHVESKFRIAGLDILEKDAGFIMTGLSS